MYVHYYQRCLIVWICGRRVGAVRTHGSRRTNERMEANKTRDRKEKTGAFLFISLSLSSLLCVFFLFLSFSVSFSAFRFFGRRAYFFALVGRSPPLSSSFQHSFARFSVSFPPIPPGPNSRPPLPLYPPLFLLLNPPKLPHCCTQFRPPSLVSRCTSFFPTLTPQPGGATTKKGCGDARTGKTDRCMCQRRITVS